MPGIRQLPAPATLTMDSFAPPQMAPVMTAAAVPTIELRVRVRGAPTTLPDAGIAVYQADHGSDCHWAALTEGSRSDSGDQLFTVPTHARGDIQVAFAPMRSAARHGYIARVRVPMEGRVAEVLLDATTTTVTLHLPPGIERAGPIRLSRSDDPQWLPMAQTSSDFTLTDSAPLTVMLGVGNYEVSSPLQPSHRQPFAVPATRKLILQCAPAAPPTGRQ